MKTLLGWEFALAAPGLEDQDEDEDHAGDPRSFLVQRGSIPFRFRSPLRWNSPMKIPNLASFDEATHRQAKIFMTSNLKHLNLSLMKVFCPVFNTLLKLTALMTFATGTAQLPEPPDPPDPSDSLRHGSVYLNCLLYYLCWVVSTGKVSKSHCSSTPPRYVVTTSAGKEMNFVILVYSYDKERSSHFSWFSNLVTLAYSCDKERSSTTLSTDELQFSWFSNLAIFQLWLRSELTNLFAIILNTFTSYLSSLYVLVYIPRVLSIYLEWCCHQRTSF